ncbi:MAG: NAD(P)H-hydrate dehydratase [Planctomycetota bacterium]|nr:NAD(P)H-hydrate dehydratase [Planctomycetota bacterium]
MIRVRDIPRLPARPLDAHKGTAGLVLIVAGSRGMAGAAALAGNAALRSGAGLVKIATANVALDTVAGLAPCCTTAPLPDDGTSVAREAAPVVLKLAEGWQAIGMGPGMGMTEGVSGVVLAVLAHTAIPVVLDADGLNVVGKHAQSVFRDRPAPLIITPHPGEAGCLLGTTAKEIQADREGAAARLAGLGAVAVLKGAGTVVCDGERMYVNTTGNPGMATAGAGDVLTGLVTALVAAGMAPFDAAVLGVWAHGRAGDMAAERWGILGLTALDILNCVPQVLRL